jgi:heat-inducible transcriptional repressor
LREIVEQYVETGEPMGSRTLSRRLPVSLSPATIRNVMADLTEAGLLYSPHVSAGRLPTDRGLRLFVDGLLQFGELAEEERDAIDVALLSHGRSLQDTLAEASLLLSGLSSAAGLVLAPKAEGALKHIEFVPLASGRALVVLVSSDGQVENRVIDIPLGVPPSALQEASNFQCAPRWPYPRGVQAAGAGRDGAGPHHPQRTRRRHHRGRARHLGRRGPRRQPHRAGPG